MWRCVHRWTEDVHFSLQPRGGDSHLATPPCADTPPPTHPHSYDTPTTPPLLRQTDCCSSLPRRVTLCRPSSRSVTLRTTRTRIGGKLPPRKSTKRKPWVHPTRPAVIFAIIPFRRVSNTRRAGLIGDQVRINVQFWSVTAVESRNRLLKWSNLIIWHSSDLFSCREINLK